MKTDTQKSGSPVGRWVKKSLCAGIVMGLAMSASMSFACYGYCNLCCYCK
jgi:hypothetical protein